MLPELIVELALLKENKLLFKHCAATGDIVGVKTTPGFMVTVSLCVQLLSSVTVII